MKYQENIAAEKLADVLQNPLAQENHPKEGLFFAAWGIYILLAAWIQDILHLLSAEFWILWMVLGMGLQTLAFILMNRQTGPRVWRLDYVHFLWLFTVGGLVFVIWYFPFALGLYPPTCISTMVCLWLCGPLIATGVLSRSPLFILGGIIVGVCSPLFLLFPHQGLIIFSAQVVFGQVLPGLGWFFVKHK